MGIKIKFMFNELVLVKVSAFRPKNGKHADKNGMQNTYLSPIAGKIPNKAMVQAGTVAVDNGLTIGETALLSVTEGKVSEQYGRQFNVTYLGKPTLMEILTLRRELGNGFVVDVTDSETIAEEEQAEEEQVEEEQVEEDAKVGGED
jgi:hypothetical protein